ncbi:MAG: HD domain-containing protein [Candidatus Izemoplasma sp.]
MEEILKFYAKVDTINETTYDALTLSVINESQERITLRIDNKETVTLNAIYYFETKEIEYKEKTQRLITLHKEIDSMDIPIEKRQELMTKFYAFAPVSIEVIKTTIDKYLNSITNPVIKDIVFDIYGRTEKDFYLYPAATKFHHAYISGLSYHTSTMMKLIDGFINIYPFLNKDLLVAGIFLHDICKVVELSNYAGPEYTKEGKLIGHITMGVKTVALTAERLGHTGKEEVMLLEHMILSHHYYGNYGSPKKPNIPEALILHFIDNIDSKMTVVEEQLAITKPGEFTTSIGVVDRERFYKSKL